MSNALKAIEADRNTLLRRAYLDLIGLPPTPAEAAEFLNDRKPDAWERLIDRLLASPHYGERWARHWMDAVHFAETHGHDCVEPSTHGLELAKDGGKGQNDRAGADAGHPCRDQRAADAEFLVGDSKADRRQAHHNQARADDQQTNLHRTNPRKTQPKIGVGRLRHDTVILPTPPTANCRYSSLKSRLTGPDAALGVSA